jgi:hypothetical protein
LVQATVMGQLFEEETDTDKFTVLPVTALTEDEGL